MPTRMSYHSSGILVRGKLVGWLCEHRSWYCGSNIWWIQNALRARWQSLYPRNFSFIFVHWEEAASCLSSLLYVSLCIYVCPIISASECMWVLLLPRVYVRSLGVTSSFSTSYLLFAYVDWGMFQIQDLCSCLIEFIICMDRFLGFHHCLHFQHWFCLILKIICWFSSCSFCNLSANPSISVTWVNEQSTTDITLLWMKQCFKHLNDNNGFVIILPHGKQFHPYAAITAGFELLPEGFYLAQFHLVEGDWHLANRVIPTEAVIVQHLKV